VAAEHLTADAVVVGTGAGGGPVAAILAEAGLDVVVLEAGPRLETDDFTGDEAAMTERLYGMALAAGSGLAVYAGRCVGGSTVINDALCFRPPPEILASWRDEYGLTGLTDAAFAPHVDAVWRDVHAEPTDRAHLNRNAHRLGLGAKRLGWAASATPRNVKGCANLWLCNLGCPSGAKQSTLVTYVPRAERAGARVLAGVRVERVRIEGGGVRGIVATRRGGDGRPTGTLTVDAPLVCLAAGVLGTPSLLQRSGLPAGDGVQFHTSVHVSARFREPIHGYYGPTMAYAIHELSDVNGHEGPGVMIESVAGHPLVTAPTIPGFGAAHAAVMAQLPYLARALIVIRDRSRGRIDAGGTLAYDVVPQDLERLRAGMIGAARAYLAAGALEVHVPVHGVAPLRSTRDLARVESLDLSPSRFALVYAVHLFGGAPMGGRAIDPCDETGRRREARGLYVTDASVLPTNTGVNPQITIMANALRIARGIVASGVATTGATSGAA
jgi:choline dehydrogenase-like flavoprotein